MCSCRYCFQRGTQLADKIGKITDIALSDDDALAGYIGGIPRFLDVVGVHDSICVSEKMALLNEADEAGPFLRRKNVVVRLANGFAPKAGGLVEPLEASPFHFCMRRHWHRGEQFCGIMLERS